LFVVTTKTNTNSIASLTLGLIGDETRESFDFLASRVKEFKDKLRVRDPAVTVTDRDKQMRGASKEAFPEALQLICRFHMNENVKLQSRKKGKSPEPARRLNKARRRIYELSSSLTRTIPV
jgi:hypothetical protein